MPGLPIPEALRHQPSDLLGVNCLHPLARGMVSFVVATRYGLVDLFSGQRRISEQAGSTRTETYSSAYGVARKTNAATSYERVSVGRLPALTGDSAVTVWGYGRAVVPGSAPSGFSTARQLVGLGWGTGLTVGIGVSDGGTNSMCAVESLGSNRVTGSVNTSTLRVCSAFAWNTGNQLHSEFNGVEGSLPATSTLSASEADGYIYSGTPFATGGPGERVLYAGGAWLRLLTDAEKLLLRLNPYAVLVAPRRIWVPVAAGGGAITGTLSSTLDAATLSAAGTLALTSAAAVTLDAATLAAEGSLQAAGTGSAVITLDAATLSAAGTLALTSAAAVTLDALTLAADGVGEVVNTGTAAITLDGVTVAAAGHVDIAAALGVTLAPLTTTAAGTLALTGAAAIALAGVTLTASGNATGGVTGDLAVTMADLTMAATSLLYHPATGLSAGPLGHGPTQSRRSNVQTSRRGANLNTRIR